MRFYELQIKISNWLIGKIQKWLIGKIQKWGRKAYQAREIAKAELFLLNFRKGRPIWDFSLSPYENAVRLGFAKKPNPRPFCLHVKGGNSRRAAQRKDYNLACHRFPDGITKIWCLNNCGAKWQEDEAGWSEAVDMFEQSSNRESSSEIASKHIHSVVADKTNV